jgi:C-terminal processing protease CtpA/Prc
MRAIRALLVAALAGLASSGVADDAPKPALLNASFEETGDAPAGWTLEEGARNDAAGGTSAVAVDRSVSVDEKASLRLSGDARTSVWSVVGQDVAVRAGDRVNLACVARCRGVHAEGKQFANAGATLGFYDAGGKRLALLGSPQLSGDRDWVPLGVTAIAPPGTVRARAGLFLSMTGTAWFDAVRVDAGPATAADRAGRERTFAAFEEHLVRTYSFFGVAGKPHAAELFERHREAVLAAADEDAFVAAIVTMLRDLDDVHVTVRTKAGLAATANPGTVPSNWNFPAVRAALTETTLVERNLVAGRIGTGADAVGYLMIGTFVLDAAGVAHVESVLDSLDGAKSLILDVRPNGGGDEQAAARIAGRFTGKDVLYARCRWRDATLPGDDGLGPPQDRVLKAAAKQDARRVCVLQGPGCVSSTEGFLLMANALPNVTTVGLPSRGASANPAPFELLPGVTVTVSRWRSYSPAGELVEGTGVAPKVRVEHDARTAGASDPTLAAALAELAR